MCVFQTLVLNTLIVYRGLLFLVVSVSVQVSICKATHNKSIQVSEHYASLNTRASERHPLRTKSNPSAKQHLTIQQVPTLYDKAREHLGILSSEPDFHLDNSCCENKMRGGRKEEREQITN